MAATPFHELLAMPAPQRVELAMALWQSLETAEQELALAVDPELSGELERRWARHLQHPGEAVSWEGLRQDLGLG
jgi:putative addiction module component (TIGR02574 family)